MVFCWTWVWNRHCQEQVGLQVVVDLPEVISATGSGRVEFPSVRWFHLEKCPRTVERRPASLPGVSHLRATYIKMVMRFRRRCLATQWAERPAAGRRAKRKDHRCAQACPN